MQGSQAHIETDTPYLTRQIIAYIGNDKALKALAMEALLARKKDLADVTFRSFEHGSVAALWKVADLLGLETILDEELPQVAVGKLSLGRALLISMIHGACDPEGRRDLTTWAQTTSLPHHLGFDVEDLDPRVLGEVMSGVAEEALGRVRERVAARLCELFPDEFDLLEVSCAPIVAGHERPATWRQVHGMRGETGPCQLTLRMLGTRSFPLLWEICEEDGSDEVAFAGFVAKAVASPVVSGRAGDVTLVLNGEGASDKLLAGLPCHFVCGRSLEGLEDLLEIGLDEYEAVRMGDACELLALRVEGLDLVGTRVTGVLTFCQDVFDAQVREAGGDSECDACLKRRLGKELVVTDQVGWSCGQILEACYHVGSAEAFISANELLDQISLRGQSGRTGAEVRVQMFARMLSAILSEVLRSLLAAAGVNLSRRAMLDALSKVREGWVRLGDGEEVRGIEELGSRERELWDAVETILGGVRLTECLPLR